MLKLSAVNKTINGEFDYFLFACENGNENFEVLSISEGNWAFSKNVDVKEGKVVSGASLSPEVLFTPLELFPKRVTNMETNVL